MFPSILNHACCVPRIPFIGAAANCWSWRSSFPGSIPWRRRLQAACKCVFCQFLQLDLAGAALYVGCYFGIGFVFSGALTCRDPRLSSIRPGHGRHGDRVGCRLPRYPDLVAGQRARAAARHLFDPVRGSGEGVLSGAQIYDVRSHGYFDANAIRIKGSKRLRSARAASNHAGFSKTKVYLYCTCVREATSRRVARELAIKLQGTGVRIAVIKGGLRAWCKAGLPTEVVPPDDMAALPLFD